MPCVSSGGLGHCASRLEQHVIKEIAKETITEVRAVLKKQGKKMEFRLKHVKVDVERRAQKQQP